MTFEFFEWFTELGQLTSIVTFAVTILGMISLLFVNMGRYIQAKKFGIPLRNVHQANIAESAELWIALTGTLGFGVILPFVFLYIDLNVWLVRLVVFVFFILGLIMTKHGDATHDGKKVVRDGKKYKKVHNITFLLYTIQTIPASFAYTKFSRIYHDVFIQGGEMPGGAVSRILTVLMALAFILYFFRLFKQLYRCLIDRLFGNTLLTTTVIDGKKYFVAMRHNVYQWYLMEYDLVQRTKKTRIGIMSVTYDIEIATFSRGKYIVKDLSELDGPLESSSFYEVRDKNKRGVFTYEYEVEEP